MRLPSEGGDEDGNAMGAVERRDSLAGVDDTIFHRLFAYPLRSFGSTLQFAREKFGCLLLVGKATCVAGSQPRQVERIPAVCDLILHTVPPWPLT
jgi:hypothetical protein